MICTKLSILVPVALVLLFSVEAQGKETSVAVNSSINTAAPTSKAVRSSTSEQAGTTQPLSTKLAVNVTATNSSITTTKAKTGKYPDFRLGGVAKRLFIVTAVLSLIVGFYFVVKFCRAGKRKARKYGVVKTPGDLEMRPLESDDDDDDDITVFNRKD